MMRATGIRSNAALKHDSLQARTAERRKCDDIHHSPEPPPNFSSVLVRGALMQSGTKDIRVTAAAARTLDAKHKHHQQRLSRTASKLLELVRGKDLIQASSFEHCQEKSIGASTHPSSTQSFARATAPAASLPFCDAAVALARIFQARPGEPSSLGKPPARVAGGSPLLGPVGPDRAASNPGSPLLERFPPQVLIHVLAWLGARDLASCIALRGAWSDPSQSIYETLCSDVLWKGICQRHWATKAPSFWMEAPGREAMLLAAHPKATWKRLFLLVEADGRRWELAPAELRHLFWQPCALPAALPGSLLEERSLQQVAFVPGHPRPRGAVHGSVYRVVRLPTWEWLLVGRHGTFTSVRQAALPGSASTVFSNVDNEDDWLFGGVGVLTPVWSPSTPQASSPVASSSPGTPLPPLSLEPSFDVLASAVSL